MKFINPYYKDHYTTDIVSNGLLFISGQLSIDPDTRVFPDGGIEEHARLALSNLEKVLKEAGADRSSVV